MTSGHRLSVDARLLAVLLGGALPLAAAAFFFWPRLDPGLTRATLRQNFATDYFDSHPDPDVGHLQLGGKRTNFHGQLSINSRGLREREFALPKPPGTVRVVLLGDSMVFGWKAEAGQRLGARLEQLLRQRHPDPDAAIEVLHFGVLSWNLASACAYLRRQLDQLQPDLVVQVSVLNDLDDCSGVRGWGWMSNFAPAVGARADSLIFMSHAQQLLGFPESQPNFLTRGWEHESRSRFDAARDSILGLVEDLNRLPSPAAYLLLGYWAIDLVPFHAHIGSALDPSAVLYLPRKFWSDPANSVARDDSHWSAVGHERIARILYGVIRGRGLLPRLALEAWPEVEEEADALAAEGLEEVPLSTVASELAELSPVLDPRALTVDTARQVLGGLDREGLVSPYSALVLGRPPAARSLRVSGRFFPDRILEDGLIRVFVEEFELATLAIRPGEPIDLGVELPREVSSRPALSVRFTSGDYVYRGSDLRRCVVFQLDRVAIE